MTKGRLYFYQRAFVDIEPLVGNALWGGVAWVAVSRHLYGFLAAMIVFKVLNELTVIQHRQDLD